jgi:hypothetical protein
MSDAPPAQRRQSTLGPISGQLFTRSEQLRVGWLAHPLRGALSLLTSSNP